MTITLILHLVVGILCCGVGVVSLYEGSTRFKGVEHVRGRDQTYWIVVCLWSGIGISSLAAAARAAW